MTRRTVSVLVVVVLLVNLLTMTVFAADDDGGSFWDVIDAVGGWFRNLFEVIGNAVSAMLDGLKALFIPREGYFQQLWARIHEKFSEKFGGIASSISYLSNRWSSMKVYDGGIEPLFQLKFPSGHLLAGFSVDLLYGGGGVMSLIRGAFSGFIVLATVAFGYKKVTAMINT